MAKEKRAFHIGALAVLLIIFLGLLFVSTTNANINVNYNFKDEVNVNTIPEFGNQINIGEIKIENQGILPAKVRLDRFVLCHISEENADLTYQLDYLGSGQNFRGEIFPSGYYYNYAEVSANENLTLEIVPQIYSYNLRTLIVDRNLNNQTLQLHVFKIEDETDTYNYCSGKNKADAFKTIDFIINIEEDELDNLSKY